MGTVLRKRFAIGLALLLGSGIFAGWLGMPLKSQIVLAAGRLEKGKVIEATENYVEPGKNKRMMMMDLGATTCIPCKMMVPVMEELARELQGKVDIQFVDVQKKDQLAQKFKIYAIPTQIFFDKKGKELFRHEGFYAKTEIMAKLKELGLK
ncbi:MAG TPA: thioredoxin family protein [Bacillota bacterium]|nr:thioredoxin family protein [Bacillota bacterium]